MLRRLKDYYTPDNKFFRTFTNSDLTAAHFAAYWVDIDTYIYHYYCDELARGNTGTGFDSFGNFVLCWYRLRLEDFNRIYDATVQTYNPLNNYEMTEETATARARGEVQNSTDTDIKPRVTANYTTTNDDKSTGRMDGYTVGGIQDSGETPKADGKENSTTKSKYNATETLSTDTLSATGHEVETVQHKRAGNIGVESSQKMLGQEFDVRLRSFIRFFCESFERECLTGLFALEG